MIKGSRSSAAGEETSLSILERLGDPELLGQMTVGQKLLGAVVTAIIGMLVCMVVLAIIMLAIRIMHALMSRKAAPAAEAPAVPAAPAKAQPELPDGQCGIASPCAGKVQTLNASEGAAVRVGDVLLLMEAGGSLFQFPAPAAGTVMRLCAAEGDSVEAGQILVILKEKEGSADA